MRTDEFITTVKNRTGLPTTSEAEKAARSVLRVLSESISPEEDHDLASQLPAGFKDLVLSGAGAPRRRQPDMETFVSQVRADLRLDTHKQAQQVTQGVFGALGDAVTPGELRDVANELPSELQPLIMPSQGY